MVALLIAVFSVTIEAMVFRGLLDIGRSLDLTGQRIGAMAGLFIFVIGLLLIEIPIFTIILRMGRRLETRLRIAFLEKIPRLSDRYFHSRLTSDMTQRVHELRWLRSLPSLGVSFVRTCFQIMLTAAGIIFLVPTSAMIAILATIVSVGMSVAAQPILIEQDLRIRTHVGALSHFYLDAMLGLIPIRTHCAERAVRREHEAILVEWTHTGIDFLKTNTILMATEAVIGAAFSIWILFNYVSQGGEASGVLLLFYWTLNLPALGKALAGFAQEYPMQRNRLLRLLEPLGASEETEIPDHEQDGIHPKSQKPELKPAKPGNVAITLDNVSVNAGGQTILSNISFSVKPGEHIAVVGSSGAGKSSLVGLFLGWHRPAAGRVLIDGELLRGELLQSLRKETAWVDPEVQLWNRSLFENLRYGTHDSDASPVNSAIEDADLFSVLERLPKGLQTKLGEGGGLVSGGEGQRVRLGRGMLRPGVRLVILDEPFRGLDRGKRRELLDRARQHWQNATLIFISHDVGETMKFERVLVIEGGRLEENDTPKNLIKNPDSRYSSLLESEETVRKGLWESAEWRHLWLEGGKVAEK